MSDEKGRYEPVKHTTTPSVRWALWQWFDIPDGRDEKRTYLRRLRIVQTPWFGVYLHWIFLPDEDRDPHDHPWNFTSVVLRGGYTEYVYPRLSRGGLGVNHKRSHTRFSAHRMTTEKAHRIEYAAPGLLTLILVGRRRRTWGFWTEHGFVEWRNYDRAVGVSPQIDEFA